MNTFVLGYALPVALLFEENLDPPPPTPPVPPGGRNMGEVTGLQVGTGITLGFTGAHATLHLVRALQVSGGNIKTCLYLKSVNVNTIVGDY